MPRNPIDYSKTIMYKIVCNDLSIKNVYVGHTTDEKSRKREHKSCCNNPTSSYYHLKVYQFIRDNGGWENWTMLPIETFSCKNKQEATIRERYWYENLNGDLNSRFPTRTQQEYQQANTEKIKDYRKEYQQANIEKIKDYQKDYQKIYYEENKEKLMANMKNYFQKKKEIKRLFAELPFKNSS
jgi:hypothetical protein